jgi:hypothetical protein
METRRCPDFIVSIMLLRLNKIMRQKDCIQERNLLACLAVFHLVEFF